jgi:hypothetical protein
MRRLLVVVGAFAAVTFLTGGWCLGETYLVRKGLEDAADEFFAAVKRDDLATARRLLAADVRASTDEAALRAWLARSAVPGFREASWSRWKVERGRGELDGSLTPETGGAIPIRLTFVDENGAWKIDSLQEPAATLGRAGVPAPGRASPGR